ncbi:hypothetical protein [Hyphomicrobium sp.]|uniref:hypothetical protein n=1 Tax=Hyphomicrobium sp. TaxID=82 RepID=UPI003F722DD5
MGKKANLKDIEAALKRAAETAKTGARDARSGKFLVASRLASSSQRPDKHSAKK